jgi:N-acetyl-alpha-D-muramate 1-phosphate uridylyltransferase
MKTAMLLAAGRGERLKPLTDKRPKALCLVHNKPLIEHHIIRLARSGFDRVVINHAYLGGQIRSFCGDGARFGIEICYSAEPPGGLETGGGIVNALPLLGKRPFITINADIYTDFDLLQIATDEVTHATVVLTPKNPSYNHLGDFGLTGDNQLTNSPRDYTFAGIACYHPSLFIACQPGRYSVAPLIREWVAAHLVTGILHPGVWFDIGSLERLHAANQVIGKL